MKPRSRSRLDPTDFIETGEYRTPKPGEFYRFGHLILEASSEKVAVKLGRPRTIVRRKSRGVKITERIEIEIDGRILTDDEVQTLRDALAA